MSEIAATVFTGTRIVARAVFTPAGTVVATDPTAVSVKIRKPDGTKLSKIYGVDPEVNRVSTGVYELRWVVDMRGDWKFGFQGYLGATPIVFDEVAVKAKKPASTA